MKLLLVSADDSAFNKLSVFSAKGLELIHYRNVLKAMDNVDEADPAGIIISARDFPRHWKTTLQFVRAERSRNQCPVILLRGENFPDDENVKAEHLGVNVIVSEALEAEELKQIENVFSPGPPAADGAEKIPSGGTAAKTQRRFGFMFTNPVSEKIITGEATGITAAGLSMEVDRPILVKDLKAGMEIPGCSLRAGEAILSPACVIRRTTYGGIISLDFISFPENEQAAFDAWIGDAVS
jgi:hypothetical protein